MPIGIVITLVVTLEVFSGRPNPEWRVTPAQSAEFAQRLAALPNAAEGVAQPDELLGYRGFSVSGLAAPVHVFHGRVIYGRTVLADPARELERWLLESGRASIDPGLAAYAYAEIAAVP